jgi:hypothetical protein
MDGTTPTPDGRSVQLAVMAAPSTSVVEAVAEARRRHEPAGRWITLHVRGAERRIAAGPVAA